MCYRSSVRRLRRSEAGSDVWFGVYPMGVSEYGVSVTERLSTTYLADLDRTGIVRDYHSQMSYSVGHAVCCLAFKMARRISAAAIVCLRCVVVTWAIAAVWVCVVFGAAGVSARSSCLVEPA